MDTKDWLSQGKHLTKERRALKDALEKAHTITDYSDNYKSLLETKIDELTKTNSDIISAIYMVNDNILRTLLIERFINNKTWEMVSHRLGYDFYHVIKRLYPKAVAEVDKIIQLKAS